MAPEVEAGITQTLDSGQLTLMAAKVASIEPLIPEPESRTGGGVTPILSRCKSAPLSIAPASSKIRALRSIQQCVVCSIAV